MEYTVGARILYKFGIWMVHSSSVLVPTGRNVIALDNVELFHYKNPKQFSLNIPPTTTMHPCTAQLARQPQPQSDPSWGIRNGNTLCCCCCLYKIYLCFSSYQCVTINFDRVRSCLLFTANLKRESRELISLLVVRQPRTFLQLVDKFGASQQFLDLQCSE